MKLDMKKKKLPREARIALKNDDDARAYVELKKYEMLCRMNRNEMIAAAINLLRNDADYRAITIAKARGAEVIYSIQGQGNG